MIQGYALTAVRNLSMLRYDSACATHIAERIEDLLV